LPGFVSDAIEALKARVPFWKELYADGEEWIGRGS
jgi:molybdopterin synthase catalytic subunit